MQVVDRPEVVLSENELLFCRIVAAMRNDGKENAHVISKKIIENRSEYDTHYLGVRAEYAVAKYYGVLPDLKASLLGDGNKGDLIVNGRACQIKCRDKVGWDYALLNDRVESFGADCGVLVYMLAEERFRIQGVISRQRFAQVAKTVNYGYGNRLAASAEHFSHPDVLLGAAQQAA